MKMKGMKNIRRYSLLNESWLDVIDNDNQLQKVSLIDIFKHSHQYKRLSGDTAPQDFAILRLLLSILQTVFMRYKTDGEEQTGSKKQLQNTWRMLWKNQQFPMKSIEYYLEYWKDRFYLYDDQCPFLQITQKNLDDYVLNQPDSNNPGHISAKFINRTLSESNNKPDLFAPTANEYKNKLTDDKLVRWLITFQGYTGTSDKSKFPEMKRKKKSASRGWLLDLGSIYLQGDNLFETLMLNLILDKYQEQTPIWECNVEQKIDLFKVEHPQNLTELYTNCSRLLVIDPTTDLSKDDVDIQAIQLPGINDEDGGSLEPMSLLKKDKKGHNVPKTHNIDRSLWTSFGLLVNLESQHYTAPRIIDWYQEDIVDETVDNSMVKIVAVGMTRNSSDPSSTPNGEVYDELNINKEILKDIDLTKDNNDKWANEINDEADNTQKAVGILKLFANNLSQIRNNPTFSMKNKKIFNLANQIEQQAYFKIDKPFKYWISNISKKTDKRLYPKKWRIKLYRILKSQADSLIFPLQVHDLQGIPNEKTNSMENVVTLYMKFKGSLKTQLKLNGDKK